MAAIQVYKYENGKYKFDISAFKNIFSSAGDNLVAIYSMTGPLRLGKSFMLGFFLKYIQSKGRGDWISNNLQNTFTYRGGSVRETTGIWLWSEPYVIERDGKRISVFLMDTQGCFDQETSMQENAFVFALSTLLSSVMIFNIKRQLSEDILQFLQYFAGFARLADNDKFDEPFQKLMFLIRDWEFSDYPLGYYDDNTSIDGKNYKKIALDIRQDQPREVKYVHESILSTFENVSFYLMPHPGREVAVKSNFDLAKVDEDFLTHLGQFVPLVLSESKIIPKKIGGQSVTGNQFIKFVEKWAQMFEKDIPEGKSIFEATAQIQNEMAKSAAIDNYSRKMKAQLKSTEGMVENEFQSFNSGLMDECVELFLSFKRLGGKEFEEKYLALILEEMQELYQTFHDMNSTKFRSKETKQELEIQKQRHELERIEIEKKLNAVSEQNREERQKLFELLDENRKDMLRIHENAEKERQEKDKQMADLHHKLIEALNKPPIIIEKDSGGCSIQ